MAHPKPKYVESLCTLAGAIEEARTTAEELRDELQEWYDNLPEQFQSGDKGSELQEAIDQLTEGVDALEGAEGELNYEPFTDFEIKYQQPSYTRSVHMSRARRLEVGIAALTFVPTDLDELGLELKEDSDAFTEAESVLEAVQTACSAFESVCFPAMR